MQEYQKYQNLEMQIKSVNKQLDEYKKKKQAVNKDYFQSMKEDKLKFGLQEITDKSIEKVTKNVSASGSNSPIITILWYFNLLKLKNTFNPKAIKFPIILDSPNNGELDDTKKENLFKYLFTYISKDSQCIISTYIYRKITIFYYLY
uniref:hypothetical protein n=1 Tax=Candidatus Enterococcus willemsii TaxID=1857215 RepID=UPI00403F4E71